MKKNITLIGFSLLTLTSTAQAGRADDLFAQGNWDAAAQQAIKEEEYALAALAFHMQQECPTAEQPRGERWSYKLASESVKYSKLALNQKLSDVERMYTSFLLPAATGIMAQTSNRFSETMGLAVESKNLFQNSLKQYPDELFINANVAAFYGRSYARGGIAIGITKGDAQLAASRSAKLFNTTPDATSQQQVIKAWGAFKTAESYEGLHDRRLKDYLEAAMKLGEQSGTAEGKCIANLARVHSGQKVTDF